MPQLNCACVCVCLLWCAHWQPAPLGGSSVLSTVDPHIRTLFEETLHFKWMPSVGFSRLRRIGHVADFGPNATAGMSPRAFHTQCDTFRASLLLVRSEGGQVFGGYTTVPWRLWPVWRSIHTPVSMLFCVTGPYGDLVAFPQTMAPGTVGPEVVVRPVDTRGDAGPCFGHNRATRTVELGLRADPHNTGALVGVCALGTHAPCAYADTLGQGPRTFTGSPTFRVEDVEVYPVVPCEYDVVTTEMLRCSVFERSLLRGVSPAAAHALLGALAEWLPRRRVGPVLYAGRAHGPTPAAFHVACDGQGPTLTLVRSDKLDECQRVWECVVFGGYTSTAWSSVGGFVPAPDAFMFSVCGPRGEGTRFPLKADPASRDAAMYCDARWGPCFGRADLRLGNKLSAGEEGDATHVPFYRAACYGRLGESFALHRRDRVKRFTHTTNFPLFDVEVYLVVPA